MTLASIAVGLDTSHTSHAAFAWAAAAAASATARLQAIAVWTSPVVSTYHGTGPSTEDLIRRARSAISSAVTAAEPVVDVDSVVVHGSPGPSLTAEASGADLLVVGRSNRPFDTPAAFGEVLVGSTARYCVNHAAIPVAVIPQAAVWVERPHVVLGIDGSPTSLAALRWAATTLAPSATIHAVHAMVHPCGVDEVPLDYELLDPIVAESTAQLERLVNAHTCGTNRTIRSHVIIGSALDILIDPGFAFDMVVLGEHGETAATAGVIGSVADYTLRHASVPLIVVPASAALAGPADDAEVSKITTSTQP